MCVVGLLVDIALTSRGEEAGSTSHREVESSGQKAVANKQHQQHQALLVQCVSIALVRVAHTPGLHIHHSSTSLPDDTCHTILQCFSFYDRSINGFQDRESYTLAEGRQPIFAVCGHTTYGYASGQCFEGCFEGC